MKKCQKLVLGVCLAIGLAIVLAGCSSFQFYDRNISMKESCVLEFKGDETINFIRGENSPSNESSNEYDSWGYQKISGFFIGNNTLIIPAGYFSLGYSVNYQKAIDAENQRAKNAGGSYWYTNETFSAVSEPHNFEIGKRYKVERIGKTIKITETGKNAISSSGVMVMPISHLITGLGYRYNNGIAPEFGPQMGLSIISDSMVMYITGDATIGVGFFGFGEEGFGAGAPYRAGGSIITFFGKSKFGLSLGGGIVGQTIMLSSDENGGMRFPQIQIPYIQAKGLFHPDKDNYMSFGLYIDYYPTKTPFGTDSFGFGIAGVF